MDIGALLKTSWDRFASNIGMNIVIFLVGAIAGMVLSLVSLGIAGIPVFVGMFKAYRRVQQGGTADMSDLFGEFSNFSKWFMLWVLGIVFAIISGLTFGLGGIVGGFLIFFTVPLMIDKDMQAFDAAKASFEYMKDNVGTMIVPFIVMAIISAAGGAIYVGTLVTGPWMYIATWQLYDQAFGTPQSA